MATSSTGGSSNSDGSGKKVRKPYTITKSREVWTDEEHDKFLEALQLFDRDWKKIEDFVGSKTVIQIRSHAQKYFLKVQKNGTIAHVPPARPKRKAAHPYPHKATKAVSTLPLGYVSWDETPMLMSSAPTKSIAFQDDYSILQGAEDIGSKGVGSICRKSANGLGNSGVALQSSDISKQGKQASILHGTPDFKQVYSFIGSIFDLGAAGLSQKLKEMDPINHETVLLLIENLTLNMISPDFELYSEALMSHEANTKEVRVAAKNQMSNEPC